MSSTGVRKESNDNRRIIRGLIEDDKAFVESLKVGIPGSSLSGLGSGSGGGGGSGGGSAAGNFLSTRGGTMIGSVALFPILIEIANDRIDISDIAENESSRIILNAEGGPTTDDLIAIDGALRPGQLLNLQGTITEIITIRNLAVDGNIRTFDGLDLSLVGNQNLWFIFDSIAQQWVQIGGGTGVSVSTVPIALLKMDGDVLDSIGTNDGTVTSTTAFTDGVIGQAFSFDGSSYITLANEPNFDFDIVNPFTISIWVEPTSFATRQSYVMKTDDVTNAGFFLRQVSGTPDWQFGINDGTTQHTINIAGATQWTHLVATYDGSSNRTGMRIYVNGILAVTGTDAAMSGSSLNAFAVTIGAEADTGFRFTGKMDDVRIYDQALSANEILENYLDSLTLGSSSSGSGSASEPYGTTLQTPSSASGVLTINLNFHTHTVTVDEDITSIVFSNLPGSGQSRDFRIRFNHDGVGGTFTVTFPASAGSNSFNLSSGQSAVYVLHTEDQGVSYEIDTLIGTAFSSGVSDLSALNIDVTKNWAGFGISNLSHIEGDENVAHLIASSKAADTLYPHDGWSFNVPTAHDHRFYVNDVEELIIDALKIDVLNKSFNNYIGWVGGVGQSQVVDGIGTTWQLPATDLYTWNIGGLTELSVSSVGLGVRRSITFTDTAADPTATGEIQRNGADVKVFTGGGVVNLSDVGVVSSFDDNSFAIFDNVDTSKVAIFQASGITTSTTRTYSFPDDDGTLALLSDITSVDLDGLSDVTITSPSALQVLRHNGASWVNASVGIGDLSDVIITAPATNAVLKFNGTNWIDSPIQDGDLPSTVMHTDLVQTVTAQKTFDASGTSIVVTNRANFNGDCQVGSSIADSIFMNGLVSTDIIVEERQAIRAESGGDPIGFFCTDQTGVPGNDGTMQTPHSAGALPAAVSTIKSDMGDYDSAIGFYYNNGGSAVMTLKRPDGKITAVTFATTGVTVSELT